MLPCPDTTALLRPGAGFLHPDTNPTAPGRFAPTPGQQQGTAALASPRFVVMKHPEIFFPLVFILGGAKSGGETSHQLQLSKGLSPPRMLQPGGAGAAGKILASPWPPPERAGVPRLLLAPWPRAFPLSALHTPRRVWRAAFAAPAQKTRGRRFVNPAGPQLEKNSAKSHTASCPPPSPGSPRPQPCRAPPAPRARDLKPFGDLQRRSSGWQWGRGAGFPLAPFHWIISPPPLHALIY